ncbi:MAG: LPS export ABC transporter periplasmic protein LptC, partial [Leptospiraceae bacterium]|nr:LPS export ABC transporter periplasmic protein LptC [Leptospiraceae bacterium]
MTYFNKNFFIFAWLLVLHNFVYCKKVHTVRVEKDKLEGSSIAIKDYIRYAYDNEGNLKWKLLAKETYYFQKEAKTVLFDIYAEQYEDKKLKAKLWAKKGEILQNENLMKLEGDIKILSTDGKTILAEELTYNTDEQILRSEKHVTIQTKGTTIRGLGLEADKNIEKYKILKPMGISVG